MRTIVLATQKGGSGKSTLAIGLAVAAMQAGHVVRMIDADRQRTIANWRRRTAAEPVVEPIANVGEIERRLHAFDYSGVTLTIIDTAGGANPTTAAAIRCADLCLIPSRPSPIDIKPNDSERYAGPTPPFRCAPGGRRIAPVTSGRSAEL